MTPILFSSDDISYSEILVSNTEKVSAGEGTFQRGASDITGKCAYFGLRVRKTSGGASTDVFRVYRAGTLAAPTNLAHEFSATWAANGEEAYDQIPIPAPLDGAAIVTAESDTGATHEYTFTADFQVTA